jgi:hypothetical protein
MPDPEEQLDLGQVMESIKRMRADFQGYMHQGHVPEKLEQLQEDMMFV